MRRIMTRIMVLASLALLIAAVPVQAATTIRSEGLDTLDAINAGPRPTHLTNEEGGDATSRAGPMLKINPTTVIILAPGDDRAFGTSDDGVWHCYRLGTAGQGCEFLETGAISSAEDCCGDPTPRKAIVMNSTTAVVLGGGPNDVECESASEGDGTPDDLLLVLRRLGAPGATVEEVDGADLTAGGLCFGAIGSTPIRINNNTVLFNQPGADVDYTSDSSCDPPTADADDTVVVAKIGARTVLWELEVGADLGVYLSGAPASVPVRLHNGSAVIASPGEDSQFADDDEPCTDNDDGLIVVRNLASGTPVATFKEIGHLAANLDNRPVMINSTSVVVLGTGDNRKQQEQEVEDDDEEGDDEIHVVRNLGGTPVVTTFDGFGFMRRPKMLNATTAVAFEEDQSMAMVGCCTFEEDLVRLNVHRIKGIGGVPSLTTIPISNGDAFHQHQHLDHSTGLAMTPTQMLFAVTGPPQVYLLNDGPAPFLGSAGGSADDWAEVKFTKVNATTAGYTRAKEGGIGVIKINPNGSLTNYPVTLQGEGNDSFGDDGWGMNQPASQPVAISTSRFVIASQGSNNMFSDASYPALNGHDDGFTVVETSRLPPTFKFVTVRNSCGAFGCQPLALGTPKAPIVAILGTGDNGQFDNNDDETDDDDELNVVTGF